MRSLTRDDAGKATTVAVGETFQITLGEHAGTGFHWRLVSDGSPACETIRADFAPGRLPGGEAARTWEFAARQAGAANLEFALGRSWEPAPVERCVFPLVVK